MKNSLDTANFYEGELKQMEKSNTPAKGWQTYDESPYAIYKRYMEKKGHERAKDIDTCESTEDGVR